VHHALTAMVFSQSAALILIMLSSFTSEILKSTNTDDDILPHDTDC